MKEKYFISFIFIFLLLWFLIWKTREHFSPFYQHTRNTRGMYYDLRCTPKIPKKQYPWNNGTMDPGNYGRCLLIQDSCYD